LDDETFLFTTFTGVRVEGVALHEDYIYAATEEGVYRALQAGINLNDFGNWRSLSDAERLPGDYTSTAIAVYKGDLYFGVDKDIYRFRADTAALFFDTNDERPWRLQYLSVGPNWLLGGYRCTDDGCSARQLMFLNEQGAQRRVFSQCIIRTNYAIEDDRGRIWFGEDPTTPRIRFFDDAQDNECNEIEYSGPLDDNNYRLLHDGDALWVAPSVLNENFGASFNFGGAYRFQDNTWTFFNRENTPVFQGQDGAFGGDDDVAAIVDVHYDPSSDRHWFSSAFEGAIKFDATNNTGELFDETNSSLRLSPDAGPGRVRVMDAASDPNGFTYLANGLSGDGLFISVQSPEGDWAAIGGNCNQNTAIAMVIDQQGYLWTAHSTNSGNGLTVLDPMGTPLDPTDDRCR
ncbi:MAG: hypothetical protein AAF840_17805, partial [Bacteroidota bacterium]